MPLLLLLLPVADAQMPRKARLRMRPLARVSTTRHEEYYSGHSGHAGGKKGTWNFQIAAVAGETEKDVRD